MNKKSLFIILITIIILLFFGIFIYPIFYKSSSNTSNNNTLSLDNTSNKEIQKIDILSNLDFFKIIIADNSSATLSYSERFVTVRDSDTVKKLQQMLKSAQLYVTDEPRGYDTPTTAICYLDDNTMYEFFVIDKDKIVFSDEDSNKTIYQLDEKYNIEEFLESLYNVRVNSYKYTSYNQNGKYGIKYGSKNIIKPKYDSIVIPNPNVDVFMVTTENNTYFIDKDEENPFPNFENIELISGTNTKYSTWYESAIKFKEDDKYGIAGLNGSILIPAEYDSIKSLNTEKNYLELVQNDEKQIIKLLPSGYEEISYIN